MAQKAASVTENYHQFLNTLRNGTHTIYYLSGEEIFFHDLAVEEISKILPPDIKDFNFDFIQGTDGKVDQVLSIYRSFPMMSDKRVVVVRGFQQLTDKVDLDESTDTGNAGSLNDFVPFIEKPNPGTWLFLLDEKPLAKNTKIGKVLFSSPHVATFDFSKTADYLLPDWVSEWSEHHFKTKIDPQAAQLLVQFVGSDLLMLSNELEKLATAAKQEVISEKLVRELVGVSKEFTIIELKTAIVQRRTHDALVIADQIMQQGAGAVGELLKALGFFTAMYLNIWKVLKLQSKGMSAQQIATELGMNSYRVNAIMSESRLYSLQHIAEIFEILYDADRAAKGFSTFDERSIFFTMIHRLCTLSASSGLFFLWRDEGCLDRNGGGE